MTTLTAQIASSGIFTPQLAQDNNTMTGLSIQLMLNWLDDQGVPQATTQKTFDAWAMLSDQQKTNLQDIHDTITQTVVQKV